MARPFKFAVLSTLALLILSFAPATSASTGITKDKILVGLSTNLTGPSNERPRELLHGSEIIFKKVNSSGGIHGRKIELKVVDDGYEPQRTLNNTKDLVEKHKVFGLFGYYGSVGVKVLIPYITSTGIPFIAPGTGINELRRPVAPSIFNVRLSYLQEVSPLVDHLVLKEKLKSIAILYQYDAMGQDILNGTKEALAKHGLSLKASGSWMRGKNSPIDDAYESIKKVNPEAVILAVVWQPAVDFIKKARADGQKWKFVGPTTISTMSLLEGAGSDANGTIVSNAFPPMDADLEIIKQFKADHQKYGRKEPANFEGYFSALVFVEGLKRAGKNLTRESFFRGMETMKDVNIGGMKVSFAPDNHQGLNSAFLSVVKDGKFVLFQK